MSLSSSSSNNNSKQPSIPFPSKMMNTSRTIKRDEPEMRSVAVAMSSSSPLQAASLFRHRTEPSSIKLTQGDRTIQNEAYRKKSTALSLPTNESSVVTSPPLSSLLLWNNIQSLHQLQALPEIYPLERSSVSIDISNSNNYSDNEDEDGSYNKLKEIIRRISSSIQALSIHAKYNNDNDMGSSDDDNVVYCETCCNVRFCIRLFLKSSEEQEQKESKRIIVVEIQRQSGCSYTYHKISRSILRDITKTRRTKSLPSSTSCPYSRPQQHSCYTQQPTRMSCSPFRVPDSVIMEAKAREEQEQEQQDNNKNHSKEAFDIACNLLVNESNRIDLQLMGMESLVKLTTSTTSTITSANYSSSCSACDYQYIIQSILSSSNINRILLNLLCYSRLFQVDDNNEEKKDSGNNTLSKLEEEYYCRMHRHSIEILSNCLLMASTSVDNDDDILRRQVHECFLRNNEVLLIESLLRNVVSSSSSSSSSSSFKRPYDAKEAMKCLTLLLKTYPNEMKTTLRTTSSSCLLKLNETMLQGSWCGSNNQHNSLLLHDEIQQLHTQLQQLQLL